MILNWLGYFKSLITVYLNKRKIERFIRDVEIFSAEKIMIKSFPNWYQINIKGVSLPNVSKEVSYGEFVEILTRQLAYRNLSHLLQGVKI